MLETREINLSKTEWIYIPEYDLVEKKEIENIRKIIVECLVEDELEATVSFLQSLKDNSSFTKQLIEVDLESEDKNIVNILLKGFTKRYNYSKIYVFDDLLDIEKVECHFYFFDEIKILKDIFTKVFENIVFNPNNKDIDTEEKKITVTLIQALKKIEKASMYAKRKSLFNGNNIKNTIQLIQEMLPNYTQKDLHQIENKSEDDESIIHEAVILNNRSNQSKMEKKDIDRLVLEMQKTQNNMEIFKKEMQAVIKNEVASAMMDISKETSKKIETLESAVTENLNASSGTQLKIIKFIEDQERVLEKYKQKLRG